MLSPSSVADAHQALQYLTTTSNLEKGAAAVASFMVGLVVKKPIEEWWKNRGSLRKAREESYAALADIYSAVLQFLTGHPEVTALEDPESAALGLEMLTQDFYLKVNSTKYRHELEAAQSVRGSMRGEVEGFERILQLLSEMPDSGTTIQNEKVQSIARFSEQFLRALNVESFDQEMFRKALKARAAMDISRGYNLLGQTVREFQISTSRVADQLKQGAAQQAELVRELGELEEAATRSREAYLARARQKESERSGNKSDTPPDAGS